MCTVAPFHIVYKAVEYGFIVHLSRRLSLELPVVSPCTLSSVTSKSSMKTRVEEASESRVCVANMRTAVQRKKKNET